MDNYWSGVPFYVPCKKPFLRDGCCMDSTTYERAVLDVVSFFNLPATSACFGGTSDTKKSLLLDMQEAS